jgi:hypothetical protein
MRRHVRRTVAVTCVLALMLAADAQAQGGAPAQQSTKKEGKAKKRGAVDTLGAPITYTPKGPAPIFREEQPLTFTLTMNWSQVRKDRGQTPTWHAATLAFKGDSGDASVPVRVRPRGIWRLKNCDLPPLRLNFTKDSTKHSPFAKLDKPKLVSVCKDKADYDEYILEEYQLYRVLNLLTPLGFRARLAKVTYVDSAKAPAKPVTTRWAFLTEDAGELSERTGMRAIDVKGATRGDVQVDELALFGLFQYFIGNTDFAIGALHNVQLVADDTATYAIPYDFDWTGAVNPPYAFPAPQLGIRRVEDRLYRGFCTTPEALDRALQVFEAKKDAIYALYHDDIGKLMAPDRVKRALEYYDEFYKTIADPKRIRRDIVGACL